MSYDLPPILPTPNPFGKLIPWMETGAVSVAGGFVVAALELALNMLLSGQEPWTREAVVHMLRTGSAAAVTVALAYVKSSPLARKEWTEEQREAERAKLASQGRL